MIVQTIVEGHGERDALALLIRRLLQERLSRFDVTVQQPQRRRGVQALLAREGEDLIRFQRVAEREADAVLWILDHDDGCILDSLRALGERLTNAGLLKPTAFAFIAPEYETLFLEDPQACAQYYGIDENVFSEGVNRRDAKGFISSRLPSGSVYKPTTDQAPLTARLDLHALSAKSQNFRHLERVVSWSLSGVGPVLYPFRRSA